MLYGKLFGYFLIFSFFFNGVFAIGFMGSEISSDEISLTEEINFESYIVNRDDSVKSNIQLIYEFKKKSDSSLMYSFSENYFFAPNEVKYINKSISFPENLPSGDYVFTVQIKSSSGTPLSFISHDLVINSKLNDDIIFKNLPYLKIYYDYDENIRRFELSYSNTGKPVLPGDTFDVKFSLINKDMENKDIVIELSLENSYSDGDFILLKKLNESLSGNSVTNFSIPLEYEDSGTYSLNVKIYDENDVLLSGDDVRLVIMGEGGNILNVFNKQDTYASNENVELDVSYVGPADGITNVDGAYLLAEIYDEKEEKIAEESIEGISLPLNPESKQFSISTNKNLEYYSVRVVLGKGNKTYDEVILDYMPLEPEMLISKKGMFYRPNSENCFDDNICTENEELLGNCYDCVSKTYEETSEEVDEEKIYEIKNNNENDSLKSESNNNNNKFTMTLNFILVFLLIVIILLVIAFFPETKKRRSK